uniref:Uncharacterized protein n=1 Tax=Anguilla anguilla TaxID=7936 RepID=A0A0E9PNS8_ANGAN
MLFVSNKIKI